jgi:hypothetical protein
MALDLLVLNGTNINDETHYALEAIDFTPSEEAVGVGAGRRQ